MGNNPYLSGNSKGTNPYLSNHIEPTGNLLSRAMKNAQAFIPQNSQEWSDVPNIAAQATGIPAMYNMTNNNPIAGMTELGSKMVGNQTGISSPPNFPDANTEWGKEMNKFVGNTQLAVGGAIGGKRIAQEGVKGLAHLLSPKTFARKELPKASGELTGSIQEVIKRSKANPEKLGVLKDEALAFIKSKYEESQVPSGPQASVFRKWIKHLEGIKDKYLTADIISEMETKFGHIAKYGKDPGADPILAQSAKVVNRFASGKLDEIATNAGVPEFIANSLAKSKLLSTIKKKPSIGTKLAGRAVEGAATAGGGYGAYKFLKGLFD